MQQIGVGRPVADDRGPYQDREILREVRAGLATVRYAAAALNWTVGAVQMAAFGRIVL
jgi:hypothetical protein